MSKICLILSRSKFGYIVCWIEVLDLGVEYGRRKYQRRRIVHTLLFPSFMEISGNLWKIASVLFAQEITIVGNVVRIRVFISSLQYNL